MAAKPKRKLRDVALNDKYKLDQTKAYINGIEALVRLPILQHQRDQERGLKTAGFVSGYRGSPLGTVDQTMWSAQEYLDKHDITFVPGVNEDLAATAVRGSQEVGLLPGAKYDGVFGMWYGKGPGFDRSMDALRHANAAGTSKFGGVLAVVGDDHACKSSTYPYQSEHLFMSLSMPVLAPANVQEVLDLGVFGWELSRYSGCWVGLKAITENMDSAISAEINPQRINIKIPTDFDIPKDGLNVRWPDSPLAQEERLNKYKIYAALAFARENELNKIVQDSLKPRFGIITSGKSYLDVMQAFDDLGIDQELAAEIGIRVYKVGMPWPLEPVKTHEFASGLEEILVVEEKRSVIEDQLTGQLYNWPVGGRPRVIGEYDEQGRDLLTNLSELTPAMIAYAIAGRISRFYTSSKIEERVAFISRKEKKLAQPRLSSERRPTFCSGCPHNTSTAVPEGSIAGGGIGCHYMATWSRTRPAVNFTHMGGEGVTWTGQAPFTETKHIFQNLGDGTYFHSGVLAIRQSVASKVNITYKILYNDAVAMTGGQPIDGSLSLLDLIGQLKGEGIKTIELVSDQPKQHQQLADNVVSISHRDDLAQVQKKLRDIPGATVIIYEQTCATEKRRRRKRGQLADPKERAFINTAVCEGCGDCSVQSNCLSVIPKETELGRKRQIDQAACNKDFSCLKGFCPSFVTVKGGELRKNSQANGETVFARLPEPRPQALTGTWNVVITGVGGTGVLTVAAVLSMAAHLENKGVATLNQTGLAQKFGPVTSHLRIANTQQEIYTARVPAGDADLILGCDLAVSATDDVLAKIEYNRTNAVINDTELATAEFIENPDAQFYSKEMKQSICDELVHEQVCFLPATDIASSLLGDTIATNLFMVGVAYQKGLIPLSCEAIFKALELNGVAVDFNKRAFQWGRTAVADYQTVLTASKLEATRFAPLMTVSEVIDFRAEDLTAYQNVGYSDQYRTRILEVQSEFATRVSADNAQQLTLTFAKILHQVMAYKDEYEVARLHSDGRFEQQLKEKFSGNYKITYHLAPPLFSKRDPETGHLRKREFGGYMHHSFKILAKLKGLRGTPLDIFGYTAERKMERELINELNQTMANLLDNLNDGRVAQAIEIIELVKGVRGYGHVKEKNYQQYRQRLKQQLKRYRNEIAIPIEVAA